MPFKNLEHDGTEDYLEEQEFPDRRTRNKIEEEMDLLTKVKNKQTKEEKLQKEQDEWMNPMNPFLWEPIDPDDF